MRTGRVLYPVRALGPGERLGIWVQGCERKCEGCANPELQRKEGKDIPIEMLIGMCRAAIKDYKLTGITVTGGEPMLQADELGMLLEACSDLCTDVLLFTGFTLSGLKEMHDPETERVLKYVSVLVDGPYIQSLNRGEILRGSENQVIHYFNESVREKYEEYIKTNKRIIDTFASEDGIINVGIHGREE